MSTARLIRPLIRVRDPQFPDQRARTASLARRAALLLASLALLPTAAAGRDIEHGQDAFRSLREIADGLEAGRRKLKSINITYDVHFAKNGVHRMEMRVVARAAGLYRLSEIQHFAPNIPPELDLLFNRSSFDGEKVVAYFPNRGYAFESRQLTGGIGSSKVRCPLFVEATGWWPPDDDTLPPHTEPRFLLHDALKGDRYRLLPHLEQVDGAWCHVLELNGRDKLFVDTEAGYHLRKRERYFHDPAVAFVNYELGDYRQVGDAWLPFRFGERTYSLKKTSSPPGFVPESKPDTDLFCVIKTARVNDTTRDQILFSIPPGTVLENLDVAEKEQIPGGLEFLDFTIELSKKRAQIYQSVANANIFSERTPSPARSIVPTTLVSLTTVAVVMGVGLPLAHWLAARGTGQRDTSTAPVPPVSRAAR